MWKTLINLRVMMLYFGINICKWDKKWVHSWNNENRMGIIFKIPLPFKADYSEGWGKPEHTALDMWFHMDKQ